MCVKKRLFIVFSLLVALFVMFVPSNVNDMVVYAEDEGESEYRDKENFNIGEVNRSPLAEDDENFYYRLEAGMPEDDKAKWYQILDKASDAIAVALHEAVMLLNNIIFSLNVKFTQFMLGILDITLNFDFVNVVIDDIAEQISNVVGFSSTSFNNSGLFSLLILQIVALFVIIYAFYQLVWKRSFISSFGEILKFVIVLATSLLLFTNFGSFMTTMNTISSEMGELIVNAASGGGDEKTRYEEFSEAIWKQFVDDPYMYLQYGTADFDQLEGISELDDSSAEGRVRELLTRRIGSESRSELVDYEINEMDNYYMQYDSVVDKSFSNITFLILNGLTSIPIYIIGFAIVFTQFWFVAIAMIAPFALFIASFPTQFNVLKRYAFELCLPLLIKIALHVMLLFIMFMSQFVTSVNRNLTSDMLNGVLGETFINGMFYFMLFIALFLLRHRIMDMLTSGSKAVGEIREGLGSITRKPVQGATSVAGTAIGATVGGATGAVIGANIGSSVGSVVTGEEGAVSNAVKDIGRYAYGTKKLNNLNSLLNDENSLSKATSDVDNAHFGSHIDDDEVDVKDSDVQDYEVEGIDQEPELEDFEKIKDGKEALNEFLEDKGLSEEEQQKVVEQLENENINFANINDDILNDNYAIDEDGNFDTEEFVQNIKDYQDEMTLEEQAKAEKEAELQDFLRKQGLEEEDIEEISDYLKDKDIDISVLSPEDYQALDEEIRERIGNGENIDYVDEFKKGLEEKAEDVTKLDDPPKPDPVKDFLNKNGITDPEEIEEFKEKLKSHGVNLARLENDPEKTLSLLDKYAKKDELGNLDTDHIANNLKDFQDENDEWRKKKEEQFVNDLINKGISEEDANEITEKLKDSKVNVPYITPEDINDVHNDITDRIAEGEELNYNDEFIKGIQQKALENGYPEYDYEVLDSHLQQEETKENLKNYRQEKFNEFLEKRGMNDDDINDINQYLKDKGFDVAHIPRSELQAVDKEIQERIDNGESLDYKQEFMKGIESKMNTKSVEDNQVFDNHVEPDYVELDSFESESHGVEDQVSYIGDRTEIPNVGHETYHRAEEQIFFGGNQEEVPKEKLETDMNNSHQSTRENNNPTNDSYFGESSNIEIDRANINDLHNATYHETDSEKLD